MSKLDQLRELIETHNEGEGISSKELAEKLEIPQVSTVYGMINMLKRKHSLNIVQEGGLYKVSSNGKSQEQIPTVKKPKKTRKNSETPKIEEDVKDIKDSKVLKMMSDEDRATYLDYKRKAIYYTKTAEALMESYKQTIF